MNDLENECPLVLVVDDDPAVLDELTKVLSRANLGCCCCTTSEAAIAAAKENLPDLILCNVNLRGESGMEACKRIKQQPGLANVPAMFLSGAQLPDIVRRSHAFGGIYCLRKPFDPGVLLELIDQALGAPQSMSRC